MKKIFPLMLAAGLFVACHPSQSKVSERTSDVDESESSYGENYTSRLNNGVYDDTENDDVSFYDDEYNSDDEDEQLSDVSLGSDYNSYQVRCSNRNITVSDMNGNSAHYTIDSNGNLSGYDSNGNYYHSHTDNLGNTTGFDSDGNCYRSHILILMILATQPLPTVMAIPTILTPIISEILQVMTVMAILSILTPTASVILQYILIDVKSKTN